ncbi:MAG: hypothetical protein ABIK28_08075 [Planctomycetota bacterium]
MIGEVLFGSPEYDSLEAMAVYFATRLNCYGTPYNVVRVFNPGKPNTHSLILHFAFLLYNPFDFVSNTVAIQLFP